MSGASGPPRATCSPALGPPSRTSFPRRRSASTSHVLLVSVCGVCSIHARGSCPGLRHRKGSGLSRSWAGVRELCRLGPRVAAVRAAQPRGGQGVWAPLARSALCLVLTGVTWAGAGGGTATLGRCLGTARVWGCGNLEGLDAPSSRPLDTRPGALSADPFSQQPPSALPRRPGGPPAASVPRFTPASRSLCARVPGRAGGGPCPRDPC